MIILMQLTRWKKSAGRQAKRVVPSKRLRRRRRKSSGVTIAEAAASLAWFLPLMFLVLYAVTEASYAYAIAVQMTQGANRAARALRDYYVLHPEVVTNTSEQQAVFSSIRISNMIATNAQFTIPAGGWNLTAAPPRVTVVVTYLPGQGTPALPAFPTANPLNLSTTFNISAVATSSLN